MPSEDPEGAAQDVQRFPTEPWMASRKIAKPMTWRDCCVGEAPFLLVTFLWALSKKSDSPTAKAFELDARTTSIDSRLRGNDEQAFFKTTSAR
ncbi:MAG: hypothetical protein ABIP11_02480 [Luteimonas sp.]